MTHGRLNLVGDVFGWLDIGHTVTEHKSMAGQPQRFQAFNWAMQAARAQGFPVDSYPRPGDSVVINQDTDWGGLSRGRSMLLPHSPGSPWSHSRAAHEFGHVLGLDDAFRTTAGASGTVDTRYQDWYCIMSYATTGDRYQSTVSGDTSETGPGLGGLYTHRLEGIPPSRIYRVPANGAAETVQLAPLTHADEDGALLVHVPPTSSRPFTYWLELRHKSNWDRAISAARVLMHEDRPGDGASYVIEVAGSQGLSDIHDEALTTPDGSIGVRLAHLHATTAEIRVWEAPDEGARDPHHRTRLGPAWRRGGRRTRRTAKRSSSARLAEGLDATRRQGAYVLLPLELCLPRCRTRTRRGHRALDEGRPRRRPQPVLGLNHAVWNNVGGDTAVLSDSAGTEISRFSY